LQRGVPMEDNFTADNITSPKADAALFFRLLPYEEYEITFLTYKTITLRLVRQ